MIQGDLTIAAGPNSPFVLNSAHSTNISGGTFVIANAFDVYENASLVSSGPLPYDITSDFVVEDNGLPTSGQFSVYVIADASSTTGLGGYDIEVIASPEPGSLGLLGVVSLGLLRRGRRVVSPTAVR